MMTEPSSLSALIERVGPAVLAAGGVWTLDEARKRMAAGVHRQGTSRGVANARQIAKGRTFGGAVTGY